MSIEQTTPLQFLQSMAENAAQGMPTWFQQGGPIMWLLLIASFWVTVVTLERLYVWALYPKDGEHKALRECFSALNKQQKTEALLACKKIETPALKMLEMAVETLPFSPEHKMDNIAKQQLGLLSRGQSLLTSIIFIAPLLGLLGCVFSLMASFHLLSLQGVDSTALLLGVIAQSLIPMAAGLTLSIISLTFSHYFRVKLTSQQLHMQAVSSEFKLICEQKNLITNQPSDIALEQEEAKNAPVEAQKRMPYHYEFSEKTGEVTVNIHAQTEHVKRATPSSIAKMYDQELPDIYKHIKPEASSEAEQEKLNDEVK